MGSAFLVLAYKYSFNESLPFNGDLFYKF